MSDKSKEEKNGPGPTSNLTLPLDIKKSGVLRKLKTMKKKYFVLRIESESGPARLEYYDNEKKYRAGMGPKRSISIKKCFNINRKIDSKQKLAIALYTKDDCFSVVAENEQSLEDWLKAMLELQLDTTSMNGSIALKPKFEHVWQVTVGDKSLACSCNMKGLHRLCLTNTCLTLVKMDQSDTPESLEFPLMSIRRCGHSNNYFFFELGRSSITGAGEFWLETDDVVIAQNMHEVTLNAMKTCREHEDLGPHRPRSSSNSETSRPIVTRRPVAVVSAQPSAYPSIRNRCDSMPSRPRTISEGQEIGNRTYSNPPLTSLRAQMGYSHSVSYSPPGLPNMLSPSSTCCSTDSAGSSLSIEEHDQPDFSHIRYSHSVPTDSVVPTEPTIKEEQLDYMSMCPEALMEKSEYIQMGPSYSASMPNESRFLYLNLNHSENSRSNTATSNSSDYMDMTSPVSLPGDYLPMSPVGSHVVKGPPEESKTNHWNHSKVSTDGYLYMAPVTSAPTGTKSGYLEMAPIAANLPHPKVPSNILNMKNSGCGVSDTSIASSPDVKTEVYQLDKVKSLLLQTDDASEDYIRPVRAYSMGSRPQLKKTHLSIHKEGSRIRAYSVGSQASASARSKVLNSIDKDQGARAGSKSSSAPLLNNRPPRIQSYGSRGNVGEDLMEIDYNKIRNYSTNHHEDFTIEPVGRSRSGSCSSSSATAVDRRNKLTFEKEKPGMMMKSKNIISSLETLNDYLPMSPLMSNSGSKQSQDPSGDYVSLNPFVNYSNKSVPIATSQTWKPNITFNNHEENKVTSVDSLSQVSTAASSLDDSGYMCMNFGASGNREDRTASSSISNSVPKTPPPSPRSDSGLSISLESNSLIHLKQQLEKVTAQSAPNSRPTSTCEDFLLNYAHLDLSVPSDEEVTSIVSVQQARSGTDSKDMLLNYAEIDFTKPTAADADRFSHL